MNPYTFYLLLSHVIIIKKGIKGGVMVVDDVVNLAKTNFWGRS